MPSIDTLLERMQRNPTDIRFSDALKVAGHFFRKPRVHGSHRKYRTPWMGEPMVNLQPKGNGKAKAYQVRQLVSAIAKLRGNEHGTL